MPGRPRDPTPLAPRKSLGQHFLHDQTVLTRIAALARPEEGSGIVEIGPATEVFEQPQHPYTKALVSATTTSGNICFSRIVLPHSTVRFAY